jgi:hypothetical protein
MPLYSLRNGPTTIQPGASRKYFYIDTPEIYYTKTGSMFEMEDHSKFTMYVDFIITGDNVDLVILFIRDVLDDKSPTFEFEKKGTTDEIKHFLENMPKTLAKDTRIESNKKLRLTQNNNIFETKIFPGSPRVYSFKSPKNVDTFSKIANCIKSNIPGVADAIIPNNVIPPTIIKDDTGEENDENPQMAPRIPQQPQQAQQAQ